VLGGTFDPPHVGHLTLAAAASRALALDRVVLVPAGEPWRKAGSEVSPAAIRLRMAEAAAAPFDWIDVSDIELRRSGPSYSAETLEELAATDGEWWFILGADALADMPQWHEPARIVTAARLAVAARGGEGIVVPPALSSAVPAIEQRIDRVPMSPLTVSASELRERVREGRSTDLLLTEAVRRVIDETGLYR